MQNDKRGMWSIEGMARFAPNMQTELASLFQEKYTWDITTDPGYDTIIAVDPLKIMAWGSHGEGRWRFSR